MSQVTREHRPHSVVPGYSGFSFATIVLLMTCAVIGVATTAFSETLAGNAAGQTDLVLILDTSKTMRGLAGGSNIFGQVKATCKELVKGLINGDTVTLIAFDTDVRPQPTVTLVTDTERLRLFSLIDSFRADGNWTFTARALEIGLKEAARLEAAFPGHNQVVAILTDGLNDPPPAMRGHGPRLAEVAQPYAGKPWYVFQIQLGPKVDRELASAISVFPNGKTIHDPHGADLQNLPRKLQAPPPPKPVTLEVNPASLRLDLTTVGTPATGALTVHLPPGLSSNDLQIGVTLPGAPAGLIVRASTAGAAAGQVDVRVSAETANMIPPATYDGHVDVALAGTVTAYRAAPQQVAVTVAVNLRPPVWPYWLGGIVLLAAAIAVAFLVWRWMQSRRLFGQLEAWPSGQPAQITRVDDLSRHGSTVSVGNEGIVLPTVGRRLASLHVGSLEGERHVIVRPEPAERLTMQGRTQVELALFNGDSFELGGWVFRYRGETGRRR